MISSLPLIAVRCLLLTVLFEITGALILGVRSKSDLLTVTLAQVVTNPLLVVISTLITVNFGIVPRRIFLAFAEVGAVAAEGLIYSKTLDYKKLNPYLLSLLLNGFSFFLGEIVNRLIY